MSNKNPDFYVRAEILRLMPVARTHIQLAQIEQTDPDFPKAIVLGSKRFYPREKIDRWLAKTFGDAHVRVIDADTMRKPPRPGRARRKPRAGRA